MYLEHTYRQAVISLLLVLAFSLLLLSVTVRHPAVIKGDVLNITPNQKVPDVRLVSGGNVAACAELLLLDLKLLLVYS